MNDLWMPGALSSLTFQWRQSFLSGPLKVVLHTAESKSMAGVLATYKQTGNYPHLTVGETIEQHCPFNVSATALQNLSGGVQTNRDSAIQIEIVWYAADIANLPTKVKENLILVMKYLQDEFAIPHVAPNFKPYPSSYGTNNGVRFSPNQWDNFGGWCGHQHVPENLHGDPGALDIQWFLDQIHPDTGPVIGPEIQHGDDVKSRPVDVPRLDDQGNGWIPTDIPFDKVVSFVQCGPHPARDGGYENPGWPDASFKKNNTGGMCVVEIESDVPNGHVLFEIWYVD